MTKRNTKAAPDRMTA